MLNYAWVTFNSEPPVNPVHLTVTYYKDDKYRTDDFYVYLEDYPVTWATPTPEPAPTGTYAPTPTQTPDKPVIISEPSDRTVILSGASASYLVTLTAEGEGLSYQWYRKGPSESSFSVFSGKTSSFFTDTATLSMNGTEYYCRVSDRYGQTVKSNTVTLTVVKAVTITSQPVPVKVGKEGDTASINVTATGSGLTYQWYEKLPSSSSFAKSSVTTAAYRTSVTSERSGMQVYCVVTDKYGRTATSNTVTLSVADPVRITTQPSSVSVSRAGSVTGTGVSATGDGLAYQWYEKLPSSSSFVKSSITTAVYSISVTAERSGMQIYCVVTDKYGNTARSATATLSVVYPAFGKAALVLPSDVTEIELYAFDGDVSITTVEIQSGCTSIGPYAFRNCLNLTKIRIPPNCEIGTNAFSGCTEVLVYGKAGSPAEAYCKNHSNCWFAEE